MRLHRLRASFVLAAAAALVLPLSAVVQAQVMVCYAERCITDEKGVERCVLKPITCPQT